MWWEGNLSAEFHLQQLVMLPHAHPLSSNLSLSLLSSAHLLKPSISLSTPTFNRASFTTLIKTSKLWLQPLKYSLSGVSEPPRLESANIHKPSPAEVSRTIVELSSVGTLSTLAQDGSPLGYGVRFAVDFNGVPVLCFKEFDSLFSSGIRKCSLHVQLDQCGQRASQCTMQGHLEKPVDKEALERFCSAWKKRFNEEVEQSCICVIDVERVLQIEDYGQDGVWVSSSDYGSAEPDPLRDCAEKIVNKINIHNKEDIYRFCNIYVELDFQVLDAKMVWVDRLGFDVRVRSVHDEVYEVRIPFPGGHVSDEKGAKSSFNSMSQLAWEVEKKYHSHELNKVKHPKKVTKSN